MFESVVEVDGTLGPPSILGIIAVSTTPRWSLLRFATAKSE